MGSSSGKKHKKEKKHKRHRSRTPKNTTDEDDTHDVHHRRHKKHKEKHREERRHKSHSDDRQNVIAVTETDSDSSDCVEVPIGDEGSHKSRSKERERSAPPPPQITKHTDLEEERRRREYEKERLRAYEKEKAREKEKERERQYERERAYEKEKERERRKEYERRRERDRERDRGERDRERDRDRERLDKERYFRRREENEDKEIERALSLESEREKSVEIVKPQNREFSPIPENGAGDCLSIEETNKLRAKLGLKPLEIDSGSSSKPSTSAAAEAELKKPGQKNLSMYKDEWGEFLHKPAESLKDKAKAESLREKLKQRKEKRFLEERLARIQTLGESDEEIDDVSKWVQRNKRAVDEKKEAEKRAKALEELDKEFGIDDLVQQEQVEARRKAYDEKHLKGLKVDHDMDDFTEGKSIILTLKDADVLDEKEGDTLVNVNMLDDERYRKNVANKKQNPLSYGYNVYEEQYDELGNPIERGVLEKYDEDLDGNKKKTRNFVIGENIEEEREHRRKLLEIKTKLAGKRLETLADTEITLASDTLTEAEMAKFKKPKKKVKKLRQKLKADDLMPLSEESSSNNFGSRSGRHRSPSDRDLSTEEQDIKIEEEDDDLGRILSKARKLKQKENLIQKSLPVDIKVEVKTENEEENAMDVDGNRDSNIVLNATAEFCRTLGDIPTYGMAGNRDEDSNDMIDYEVNEIQEERLSDHDDVLVDTGHGTWNSVNPDEVNKPANLDNIVNEVEEVAILDEEPDVGAGVANALRLALSKGYLEKEEHNRPSNSKMAHLQAKNYSIEDKNVGEDDKFGGRRDRYHGGPIMEFKDKDNFKPNVKLEYIDDNGRILNLKEAFRYLSHKFHGKGPGKNKIEKRLKKMEQEGLMKTMSSTDTPLGTLTMLQQKQKETKTPYVVLSGGKQASTNISGGTISKFK
ncbi:U4/U6.U5 tri-snRNP-associated protein 1 [Haematobia irritans]|uniref:U4/U6.U5 tri-snRNP-associated protein 1 n=1 Tax=Haematobia irritans TaxID=7368 RepID=UPI003F50C94D